MSVDDEVSTAFASRRRSPLKLSLLVFALSIPFWLIGAVNDLQLMPGLSVSAWMACCPALAASVLVYRVNGSAGVLDLLRRSFDFERIRAKGLAFFVGALGEELGLSGYAIDPLQERWNILMASLFLGVVGVLWHLVPLLLLHRSPTWIAWWRLYAAAARILMVWLYNDIGKSMFGPAPSVASGPNYITPVK